MKSTDGSSIPGSEMYSAEPGASYLGQAHTTQLSKER